MDKLPKVSILISNFNYGCYLDECITSCLEQSYKNIEIVIVDDCSTDNSLDIIKSYAKLFPDIIKYCTCAENYGYQKALNIAIKQSDGDYLTCLDSDDALTKDSIEVKVNELIKHPDWLAVYSWLIYCKEDLTWDYIVKKAFTLVNLEKIANVGHTMMFKRDLLYLMRIGSSQWRDEKWKSNGDLEWILRLIEFTDIHLIEKPLYLVRKGGFKSWGNEDQNSWGDKFNNRINIQEQIIEEAKQRRLKKNLPLLEVM